MFTSPDEAVVSQSALLLLAQAQGSPGMGMLLSIGAMFVIMYFLILRPQSKQAKDHKAMLSALKKGDEVVTQGGMLGKIFLVGDKRVTLEIASGVRVQVLKSSVQGLAAEDTAPAKLEEHKEKS